MTPQQHRYCLEQLSRYSTLWGLVIDGPARLTRSSYLQPVRYGHRPAMLKIAMDAQECRGARLMTWWNGTGAAYVWEQDGDALLLERASQNRSLSEMARNGRDDEASRLICKVAARLHAPRPPAPPELQPLALDFEALRLAANTHGPVLARAAALAAGLLATPQQVTVLHGDLHHGNILHAGWRGWLAIDPKGLYGERGFDFANLFCNPEAEIALAPGRLARQVEVVCAHADLERPRLLAWIASWAALSTIWHIEDSENPQTALAVCEIALNELGG